MLCKLGFGAEFWRVGPTVRTGQSHISRAFMCANTRLLYLSPNMSAPLVLTAAQRPDSHQNIDPCHPDCASPRTKNAPLRSFSPAFLGRSMPMAGVLSGVDLKRQKWIYSNIVLILTLSGHSGQCSFLQTLITTSIRACKVIYSSYSGYILQGISAPPRPTRSHLK